MSETLNLPYFTLNANELAEWLDAQPQAWWTVDGDPLLTSRVDFPCPSEELSAELRRATTSLRIFDPRERSMAHGESIKHTQLNDLADRGNNSKARTFLLCWDGEDIQWLPAEDLEAANASV
jgi:hypothetical protein